MKYSFYIDIVSYYDFRNQLLESITKTEPIKNGDEYPIDDHVEIRTQIKDALKPLATKIRKEKEIKMAQADMSPNYIKRGLSAYLDFQIKSPEGVTQEEIDKYYKYSIRFSEHEDLHGEDKNRYYVELEGRCLNDLYKVGLRKYKSKKEKIQKKIRDFELEKFGKQITFITDTPENESIKLRIPE